MKKGKIKDRHKENYAKRSAVNLKKNGVRSKVGTVKTSRRKAGRWRSDFDTDL